MVLVGPVNAGKSSLINALVGIRPGDRARHARHYRDVVSATTALDGWPVRLSDTAGFRAAGDEVEREGIARARARMETADLVVLVFDSSLP